MTQRSVVVKLMAQVGSYVSSMGQAGAATERLASTQDAAGKASERAADGTRRAAIEAERAGQSSSKASKGFNDLVTSAEKNQASWERAGGALLAFGVTATAALGATAKAAMDWETAWAGVTKTVDGSPEQMAMLEGGLRDLAKTLPVTHKEIAGVAEAAGQLGVAREDILGFTKTMIDLGVSTNLTSEDAATKIAQISNVMGTMAREGSLGAARFGSALVALGNDGASTESEILEMAQRISGAGATVGATEVEVLALSNTLASMGIQAELGGGVTTRVLLKMFDAVQSGGPKLQAFASAAGMSAEEFAKAFRESPVQALDLVAKGINRVNEEGGNVVEMMSEMGIKGTQETQVMLSLANSGNLLADSLKLGAQAWSENTALVEEATKRYDTAESRVRIAWNNIKDAAISAGAVMLPVIAGIADGVSQMASFFGDLPAPVQAALSILTGLVGVTALLAGGFLVLFPRVMMTITAFNTLGISGGAVAGKLKTLGKALGIAAVALAAASAIKELHNSMQPAVASTEELSLALIRLQDDTGALDDIFSGIDPGSGGAVLKDVNSIGDALARIEGSGFKDAFGKFGDDVLGLDNDFSKMNDTIGNLDAAMGGMVASGKLDEAAAGFRSVAKSAEEQGVSLEEVKGHFPAYLDSLRQLAKEAGANVSEAEILAWAMGEIPQPMLEAAAAADELAGKQAEQQAASEQAAAASEEFAEAMAEIGLSTDGTITSLEKYTAALFAAGLATMSSREATFGWEESLRAVDEKVLEVINGQAELGSTVNATGTDFDRMTASGQNANGVFQDLIKQGLGVAQTFGSDLSKSAADVNMQLQSTYEAGVQTAIGLGLSEDAAIALTREVMGIPPGVAIETWMSDEALRMSGNTKGAVEAIPTQVIVESAMSEAAFLTAGKTKASVDDVPSQAAVDSWMSDAAFIEAVRTRAAAEGIPPDVAVDSFMQSAARNEADSTTAQILKIPKGASISSFMQEYARLEAERLKASLDAVDGRTVNTYSTHHETIIKRAHEINTSQSDKGYSSGGGVGGLALGGRVFEALAGLPTGGRVPGARSANVNKDNVLASVNGKAFALQGTEWVINPRSSDKYDAELAAINNGSFPKAAELTSAYAAPMGRDWSAPAAAAVPYGATASREMQLTGSLYLDSGEFLGKVRGIAKEEASSSIGTIDTTITRLGRGGKYSGRK